MSKITWTASNNYSFLNGSREASSIAAAVRAARAYIGGELYGEGRATIFSDGEPVREDERSIFTGFRWQSKDILDMKPKSTHGGSGRNAGRKSADGAAVKRHMVTLDAQTVERLKAADLGDGELSIGIRRAAASLPRK